jgi:hypothetical protein
MAMQRVRGAGGGADGKSLCGFSESQRFSPPTLERGGAP